MTRTFSLSHAEILAKYGTSRSKIQSAMLNKTTIPISVIPALDTYLCKLCDGATFLSQVFDGKFPFQQQDYCIIYQSCNPAQVRKSLVLVHFRAAKPELELEPICIVKVTSYERVTDSK